MWRTETIHYAPSRSRSSRSAERLGERARRRCDWESQLIEVERAARFVMRLEVAVDRERMRRLEADDPEMARAIGVLRRYDRTYR